MNLKLFFTNFIIFNLVFFSSAFCQLETGTVTDVDGNTYKTVKIGNQWWMAENLKVTHYRNGDAIPKVTDNEQWKNLKNGAYCAYGNSKSNAAVYGYLYNWYTVNDSRNIAPEGWHVPTDEEWRALVDCLGRESVAGGQLKETGTTHWQMPNTDATNESGFSTLPGGFHGSYGAGNFHDIGENAFFWSATEYDTDNAWLRYLSYNNSGVTRDSHFKRHGFSVRLVRDK
jgi:uncharacterized protein (TIGR02145 family)